MASAFMVVIWISFFFLVHCEYCHIENRSCSVANVQQKIEVSDPEHCHEECEKQKANGCKAVEYFKGVCAILLGMCPLNALKRSPDTHYFYRPIAGECFTKEGERSHTNLARDRPANQSYTETKVIPLGPAKYAVDGKNNQDYTKRSCSQTIPQKSPYWFVDLGKNYTVTSVAITNRNDALGSHLSDFTIAVTNSTPKDDYKPSLGELCVYRNATFRGELGFVCDKARFGRYVVIRLLPQSGRMRVLSLCEVEVFKGIAPQGFIDGGSFTAYENFSDAFDLARGRPALQINTGGIPMKLAFLAVDGNPERNLTRGHCAATDWIPNPWWAVDLQSAQWVRGVRLVNRNDCCADRLSNFMIAVTNTPPSVGDPYHQTMDEECALYRHVVYSDIYLDCQKPIKGRYVMVILGGSYLVPRQLSLCEVNVYTKY